jgi:CheY-like chemotaxis protein
MDVETLARATEPFFTKKGVGKGTGLGLSMVHGLAGQSGGALRLQSHKGQGTVVELWLPQVRGPVQPRQAAPELEALHMSRRMKILLVDDDSLVSTGTAAMLEDLGHTVTEAGSGREALSILEADPDFDLVITDHAMPGMTGLELAVRLREICPELPVVLASGYADLPSSDGPVLELPRLTKPFMQIDVARIIVEHCNGAELKPAPSVALAGDPGRLRL